MLLLPNKHQH